MKICGRNIRQRLNEVFTFRDRLKRIRHFRGHGVHSPYVYGLVRRVFMGRSHTTETTLPLYNELRALGINHRRSLQLQKMMQYCEASTYSINRTGEEFRVVTSYQTLEEINSLYKSSVEDKATLVFMWPRQNGERKRNLDEVLLQHQCTVVDNRAFIVVFNNHLPKQYFVV